MKLKAFDVFCQEESKRMCKKYWVYDIVKPVQIKGVSQ